MKYTIKRNRKDWKPIECPLLYFPKVGSQWIIDVEFTDSCWYNWLPDVDQYDWNKIGGVTNMFSLNNVDSAMLAWRPYVNSKNYFELTAYYNIGKKERRIGWNSGPMLITKSGVTIQCTITMQAENRFETRLKNMDTDEEYAPVARQLKKRLRIGRKIGMNIGGANNEKGRFGGVASQDMEMYVKTWYKR